MKLKAYEIQCNGCGEAMDVYCDVGTVIQELPPKNTKYYCYKCSDKLFKKSTKK